MLGAGALAGAAVGALLALLDSAAAGWPAYVLLGAACGLITAAVWSWLIGETRERALLSAVALAISLRLGLGFGLARWLPTYGNPEIHHQDGYFYPDGHERDFEAWGLANSGRPLLQAFTDPDVDDQYGGLLFVSAWVYRYLSPDAHRPLLILFLTATTSGLAVLWTWAFVRRALGTGEAPIAAWAAALYPDAVLLGATHMREPFVAAGVAAALYGYALVRDHERPGLVIIGVSVLLTTLFSPPFAVIALAVIGLAWIWEGRSSRLYRLGIAGVIALGFVAAVLLTARAWAAAGGSGGVEAAFSWWWSGAYYEMERLQLASGWVQQVFGRTPEWSHAPLATLYGVVQPFLPAAAIDRSGVPLMRVVMTVRALGWFALLPFFLYALLRSAHGGSRRTLVVLVAWVTAAVTLAISYRYAGDQWDNPRYRVALLALYAALVAWGWVHARAVGDPWLARLAGLVLLESLVFAWWYAGRHYHVPRLSLWKTFGLAIGLGLSGVGLAVAWDRRRRRPA